jgi:decaprenylphospho-beta-D-ribofuranose 2-oxidase
VSREVLYGWGRTAPSAATVVEPQSAHDVTAHLHASTAAIARGLGRSYGDAAQLAGGLVMVNRELGGISPVNARGEVTVGAGVSIDELIRECLPQGWFVPVTPGTRQVTVGGAIAADVHGKNHHVDGSFGHHLISMELVTPTGTFTVSPTTRPELFWATVGGMGLTGVVVEATLRMLPVETDRVLVDTQRFKDLDSVMSEMLSGDHRYRYSVAWVDCMTRGASMGRAILTRGDHARRDQVETPTLLPPRGSRITVPFDAPSGLLNPATIRLFNEAWYRAAPKSKVAQPQGIGSFFHPLDGVTAWNRLYGRRGFVQYQFAVPDSAGDAVRQSIETLSNSKVPSFLAVLKRFGEGTPGGLSFPMPGWTLALDLPVGPAALPQVLNDLDDIVLAAGGRVYLAKDSRLEAHKAHAMYPRLHEFASACQEIDPQGILSSDLARRLQLIRK